MPPLTGVAVNVTDVPEQILLSASLDTMLTDGAVLPEANVALPLLPRTPVEVGDVDVTAIRYPLKAGNDIGSERIDWTFVVVAPEPIPQLLVTLKTGPKVCQVPELFNMCA